MKKYEGSNQKSEWIDIELDKVDGIDLAKMIVVRIRQMKDRRS